MKIDLVIDTSLKETEITIRTPEVHSNINDFSERILQENHKTLRVFDGDRIININHTDIIRIYSALGKVYTVSMQGEFIVKQRLYELEELLSDGDFIRISNTEIINLKKVKELDFNTPRTIYIHFINGEKSYVSRRYLPLVKPLLVPKEKAEDFPFIVHYIGAFIDVTIFDENLIKTFMELGFTKFESDVALWKDKQYSLRLENFSPDIADKWVEYFATYSPLFSAGKEWSPEELLEKAIEEKKVKDKAYSIIAFDSSPTTYKIFPVRAVKNICKSCSHVQFGYVNRSLEKFNNCISYMNELVESKNFTDLHIKHKDPSYIGKVIECKECNSLFRLQVEQDRGYGSFSKVTKPKNDFLQDYISDDIISKK